MPTPDFNSEREIRAQGPTPDAERLRAAYLSLLKLCLCDLAGAQTLTVSRMEADLDPEQALFTRELREDELDVRAKGLDWPWGGLTMIGLRRLDDLQSCVERVVADEIEGDLIELGVWRGGASILMRATLDSLGTTDRTVWLADSFRGLPRPDVGFPEDRRLDLSWVGHLAASVEEVRANFERFGCERGVKFVEGFFEETLPGLGDRRWALVRIDGDTYESTWIALESLYPGLSVGGFLVVDDYHLIEECRAAVDDFRREHGIAEPIESIDQLGVRWRRESDAPIRLAATRRQARETGLARAGGGRRDPHLPSLQEVHLAAEVRELREHIAATEAAAQRSLANRLRATVRGLKR
jgi:O-methyltransferase